MNNSRLLRGILTVLNKAFHVVMYPNMSNRRSIDNIFKSLIRIFFTHEMSNKMIFYVPSEKNWISVEVNVKVKEKIDDLLLIEPVT